ncbi:MAG: hypothetical protein A2542_00675 [Parcubacteria group bacterium RIFOXYD2_FULL_52_8]|nr:MAG: hypothetical protein A2542_00675 [Parcubacteria group bacterium RIFOXYD2_FULL_52_8]
MDYDFIAIGDIVTDALIRVSDADEHVDAVTHANELCFSFGDKVEYESVTILPAVGNSPNAAVAAARLGLRTALVTNLGDDEPGHASLAQLERENIAPDFVTTHKGMKTNYHYVLWYKADRTILIKHEVYPVTLPDLGNPKWIYLSSLGSYAHKLYDLLANYLAAHPSVKLAFQPGTFQMKLGDARLAPIYARSEVIVCNVEEAQRILATPESDLQKLLHSMHALGPKIVLITDGPRGAYASDGDRTYFMPPYPDPKPPLERTGAGDCFAATFTSALALGLTVEQALMCAPVNSMSVVQQVGAQAGLLTQAQIKKWLDKAPADYQPKLIS